MQTINIYDTCHNFKSQLKWTGTQNYLLCYVKLKSIWKIESDTT
jgi:hypothetical protein